MPEKLVIDPLPQLIDANLDRAREGLRVIEEWCRFELSDKEIVKTIKNWRQLLGQHHLEIYKLARCTSSDSGIGLTHPAQQSRHSPIDIISANFARVQEALRVLEEFCRESNSKLAKIATKIRYEAYDLEIKVLRGNISSKRKKLLESSKIYLITDPRENLSAIVCEALEAGIKMIQYRSKLTSDIQMYLQAKELCLLCKRYNSLFIVNDRIDIALAVNADGVHLGQDDMPTDVVRRLIGNEMILGRSTHSLKEIEVAQEQGCDYLGVGPIMETKTKPGIQPLGTDFICKVLDSATIPWFAIGGINIENIHQLHSAGAKRVAVIGAVMNAKDPSTAARKLLKS